METNSKASAGREKECVCAPVRGCVLSDNVSLPSYSEYPAGRPFINTPLSNTHRTVKAFPESSGAAIISALKNLQEKIRNLELERSDAQQKLQSISRESTHSHTRDQHTRKNHDVLSQLSAAEARCSRLEKQLNHMRSAVRNTQSDRTAVLRQQVSLERLGSVHQADVHHKLAVLEQEHHRLTETQSCAERKIQQLERKLQEEEQQRRRMQDTAAQLQTGLEANRLLIQSVSPRPHKSSKIKQKKISSKKTHSPQPHYRLSLGDVPFVTGTSTVSSHSVRANVQHVLHLMKQHQPQLCNEQVLGGGCTSASSSSTSSSCSCSEDLSELLLTLQDELGHMSFEQQDLSRQLQSCSSVLRQDLELQMENLLKRMENKAEQISKLRRCQTQCCKQSRAVCSGGSGGSAAVMTLKHKPGDRSRDSLRLLKDLRSLQNTLRSDHTL
ncbi:centrosomal protein of 57 kDa [Danio rerio]|uniref:Centrosomal protein of 57 kDa n=1 Tax=Danio rerio TaxID=7955 RepID=A1L249_DANRE|nr:centrosomal protein of 57 kDa [Danio rerio]AAI29350.1 Zgc:158647 [Danio rerio]|eukprot:NP_001074152.1 centrosomal protein of 57 kDa [Danio rerio]